MNIYQKKLTKVSKLCGINYELLLGKEKSFKFYRDLYKLKNKAGNEFCDEEDKEYLDIDMLKQHIKRWKTAINDNIIDVYKRILDKDELTESEEELAIEIAYLKYSKPYRTKKQFREIKKWNK